MSLVLVRTCSGVIKEVIRKPFEDTSTFLPRVVVFGDNRITITRSSLTWRRIALAFRTPWSIAATVHVVVVFIALKTTAQVYILFRNVIAYSS